MREKLDSLTDEFEREREREERFLSKFSYIRKKASFLIIIKSISHTSYTRERERENFEKNVVESFDFLILERETQIS